MILSGRPLAFLPHLAGSITQLMAEPRPASGNSPPAGTRIAYAELTGVLDPEYTIPIRQRLARLTADKSVREIVLYVNSPGGTVDGGTELAEVVRRAAAVKPIHVVAEGYLASAAYHAVAQATTISVARSTVVGSIGTILLLVDDSEMFAALGIKVLPVASGINKSVGYPGVPIAEEHVAMLTRLIDYEQAVFEADVSRGRKLSGKALAAVTDGSVWSGPIAKTNGLVDMVMLPEDRFAQIEERVPAELYTALRGDQAVEQFEKLCTSSARVEYIEDVPERTLKAIRREYPTLSARADEQESVDAARKLSRY